MTKHDIKRIKSGIDDNLSGFKDIYGCYVNAAGEVISHMTIPVLDMDTEERAMYAKILKKTITGPEGKHLLDIDLAQDESKDEYKLLMALKESQLESEELRAVLFDRITESYDPNGKGYMILLAATALDLKQQDAEDEDWSEESELQHEYFICSICPVKEPKPALRYMPTPKAFRGVSTGSILSMPSAGFIFPSLSEGSADIYKASYYTKDAGDVNGELVTALFGTEDVPIAAEEVKEKFSRTLFESLGDDCTLDVMTSLQSKLASDLEAEDMLAPETSFEDVGRFLKGKEIPEEKIEAFSSSIKEEFKGDSVSTNALIENKTFKITSSDAEIKVDASQAMRIKTKRIDGINYFLVPVGSDVRVNGMEVIAAEKQQ